MRVIYIVDPHLHIDMVSLYIKDEVLYYNWNSSTCNLDILFSRHSALYNYIYHKDNIRAYWLISAHEKMAIEYD